MANSKKNIFIVLMALLSSLLFLSSSEAKVFIDITATAWREIPISISTTGIVDAETVGEIIKNDLYLTGIFSEVDPGIPGAEIAIEIHVESAENVTAVAVVKDLIVGRNVLKKKYTASKSGIRALAHSIADDVFEIITGQAGSFRTKFTYIVDAGGEKELHLMDWDGFSSRRIESKGLPISHTWSDNGKYVYYSAERNRKWGIYSLDMKNGEKKRIYTADGINLVSGSYGKLLAFSSSMDGSPEIYTINTDGGSIRKITSSYGIDISPSFSPDGTKIAFVSDRGGNPHIYIMDVSGENLRRLTYDSNYNQSPVWSLDGKWIAYVSRKDGKNQIFMIKSDGTGMRQLTENGNNENPTFSPNGIFIAFDSDRGAGKGIYVMRADGEGQRRITSKEVKALIPRWSPYIE